MQRSQSNGRGVVPCFHQKLLVQWARADFVFDTWLGQHLSWAPGELPSGEVMLQGNIWGCGLSLSEHSDR